MSDLDTRIRRDLGRLVADATPPGAASDDVLAALDERRRARQQARRRASRFTAVVLIGAAAAITFAVVDRGTDETNVVTDPDPVVEPTPTTDGDGAPDPGPSEIEGRSTGSEAPLSPRDHVAAVWTGSELVLWGGADQCVVDGAAFDPLSGSWRSIPAAPIDGQGWAVAVWTGDEVVAFQGRSVAAWDPRSNEWRELPDAPGQVGHAVWTGDEVVVTRIALSNQPPDVAGALDPAAGAWRDLPSVGPLEELTLTWTGTELIAFGRNPEFPWLGIEGRSLDPDTDTWRELARGPVEPRGYGAAWVEDRLVVTNYQSEAATYDPLTDTWTELPTLPVSFGEVWVTPIAIGDHVAVDGGGVVLTGDRAGSWRPVAPVVGGWPGVTVGAGRDLLLHVSLGPDHLVDGSLDHQPPRVHTHRLDNLLNPTVLRVGVGVLTLSDRVELVRVEAVGERPMVRGATTHALVDGAECLIRVEFGAGVIGVPGGEAVDVTPELDGAGWTGYLQHGGRTMRLPEGATWLECADPDRVLVLARHVVVGDDPEARHRAAERARTEAELRELERSRAEEAAQARRAEELHRQEQARLQAEAARRAAGDDAPP